MRVRLLLFVAALALSACGTSHRYYQNSIVQHEAMPADREAAVARALEAEYGDRKIVWVDSDGERHKIAPGGEGIAAMDAPAIHALWLTLAAGDVEGAEFDFMVDVGRRSVPVSVQFGLEDEVTVVSAPRARRPTPPSPTAGELRSRYRIGSLLSNDDAPWSPAALRGLGDALERLEPEELAVLEDIDFIRRRRSRSNARKGALYFQEGCTAKIFVYNNSLEAARFQFIGDPSDPLLPLTFTALHEIGHAFHENPSLLAGCAFERRLAAAKRLQDDFNDKVAARNRVARKARDRAAVAKVKRLDEELSAQRAELEGEQRALRKERNRILGLTRTGPVIVAFEKVRGDDLGPTKYAEASPKEAFAEAFALYHADPAALKRAMPRVHAWFAAGRHIEALGAFKSP